MERMLAFRFNLVFRVSAMDALKKEMDHRSSGYW